MILTDAKFLKQHRMIVDAAERISDIEHRAVMQFRKLTEDERSRIEYYGQYIAELQREIAAGG